jgi:hypothetical protein
MPPLAWVSIVGPFVVFATGLLGRRLIAPGDGYNELLPQHVLAARVVRDGHLPVWHPYAFSGYPLLATNQVAIFYPPNWLFLVLPPVLANNAIVVLSFAVAGLGAFLLARRLCDDDAAAAVAGVAFGLSPFLFAHLTHQSLIASIAWLPWVLYGFELLRERVTPPRVLLASGALALTLLAGHGQMFAFVVLIVAIYAVALLSIRALATALLLVAIGAALASAQLVPTTTIVPDTDRSHIDYRTAVSFSFPGSHTALLAFPFLFGNHLAEGPYTAHYRGRWNLAEMSGYPGMVVLTLAAAGLGAARRDRRVIALGIVGVVTFLMALGRTTPMGHAVHALPVFGQFRSWARYIVGFDLVVTLLAAYGVARLRDPATRRSAALAATATAIAVLVAAFVVPHLGAVRPFVARGDTRAFALLVPVLMAVAGAALCVLAMRAPRVACSLLVLAVGVDAVVAFGAWFEWRSGSPSLARFRADRSLSVSPSFGPMNEAPGGIVRYLSIGTRFGTPDDPDVTDLKRVRSANGFDPLAPRRYLETLSMTYLGQVDPRTRALRPGNHVLDLLRVSVVLFDRGLDAPVSLGPGRVVRGGRSVRYDYRPRLPDAFVVGAVERVTPPEARRRLAGTVAFDPTAAALVETRCPACARARTPGPAGSVSTIRWGTNTVDVHATVDRPGVLVVSQAWFPGWTATVDGRAAPVVRVDGLVQGVPVGPGRHRVELSYRAPGLAVGAAASAATLGGLLGWWLLDRRRRSPARVATRAGGARASG